MQNSKNEQKYFANDHRRKNLKTSRPLIILESFSSSFDIYYIIGYLNDDQLKYHHRRGATIIFRVFPCIVV